uniref:DUF1152 domain-containing protein n=1 Tax=Amphimedon queenslandica TaxID=400682 RepID=A0A1X7U3E1_AMPQE
MAGWSITRPRLFDVLSSSKRILLAGCGGGYDVLSSLPLYAALKEQGKFVTFASLSFTSLSSIHPPKVCEDCYEVKSSFKTKEDGRYFPELYLAQWLSEREKREVSVYAFDREIGAKTLSSAYSKIVSDNKIDAVVLVDGGTDSLMFGSEERMGTPAEDHCSMVAVSTLTSVPVKILACLGFGVDSFHGVSHGLFLENVATIEQKGGFHGCFSVSRHSKEGQFYIDGYHAVSSKMQKSIVCSSITDAMAGHFGNHHSTSRTGSSKLFINSLMTLYWSFDLEPIIDEIKYAKELSQTKSMTDVAVVIAKNNKTVKEAGLIRVSIPLPM